MELIAPIVTGIGVLSFAIIMTVLYRSYARSVITEYESGKMDVELIEQTIVANIKNKKLSRRIFRRVKQVLVVILLVILISFLLISFYSKITHGVAMIGGKGMIAVASGSMSVKNEANPYLANINNQFNTYDMISLKKVSSDKDLTLYDVIAYINNEGTNVIHRIVGVENTPSGLRYITRGDSNNADDEYKPCVDDIIGEYTGTKIPYLGAFVIFLQSFSGILTVAAVIYCLIMIESVGNKIYGAQEERLDFLQESIDFKTDTVKDESLDSRFTETVYFKNYAYTFDEEGLVSKILISEQADPQDLNSVRTDENGDGEKL